MLADGAGQLHVRGDQGTNAWGVSTGNRWVFTVLEIDYGYYKVVPHS